MSDFLTLITRIYDIDPYWALLLRFACIVDFPVVRLKFLYMLNNI